jgi:hypothetical protein
MDGVCGSSKKQVSESSLPSLYGAMTFSSAHLSHLRVFAIESAPTEDQGSILLTGSR